MIYSGDIPFWPETLDITRYVVKLEMKGWRTTPQTVDMAVTPNGLHGEILLGVSYPLKRVVCPTCKQKHLRLTVNLLDRKMKTTDYTDPYVT